MEIVSIHILFILTYFYLFIFQKVGVFFFYTFLKKIVLIGMLCEMQFRVKSELIDFKIISLDYKCATLKQTS